MKNRKKIAIVCSGGGMKGAYTAGALVALARHYHFGNPDMVVGGSASAGTLLYFIAGDYDGIEKVWTDLLATKKFISFLRFWRIMNIDYLVDRIFKRINPLGRETLKNARTKFFISATNVATGNLQFFTNKDLGSIDPYELVRASKAAPIAYHKRVKLNGRHYIDTYPASAIDVGIKKAIKEGANTLIIINCCSSYGPQMLSQIFFRIYRFFVNKNLRKAIDTFILSKRDPTPPTNIHTIKIQPSQELAVVFFTRDREKLQSAFKMGYNDVVNSSELQALLRGKS